MRSLGSDHQERAGSRTIVVTIPMDCIIRRQCWRTQSLKQRFRWPTKLLMSLCPCPRTMRIVPSLLRTAVTPWHPCCGQSMKVAANPAQGTTSARAHAADVFLVNQQSHLRLFLVNQQSHLRCIWLARRRQVRSGQGGKERTRPSSTKPILIGRRTTSTSCHHVDVDIAEAAGTIAGTIEGRRALCLRRAGGGPQVAEAAGTIVESVRHRRRGIGRRPMMMPMMLRRRVQTDAPSGVERRRAWWS